jgi:DNA-binding transcriptional LysR family regulator
VKAHARVFSRQPIDARRNEGDRHRIGCADADLAGRWIGLEFDVLHALANDFLAVLPSFMLKAPGWHPRLRALPVALPNTRAPIGLITLKGRTLTPLGQLFIDTSGTSQSRWGEPHDVAADLGFATSRQLSLVHRPSNQCGQRRAQRAAA